MFLTNIEVKNQRVLDLLNYSLHNHQTTWPVQQNNHMIGEPDIDAQEFVGDTYLQQIVDMGTQHHGYPHGARSYALKPDHYTGTDPLYKSSFQTFSHELMMELGVRVNALSQFYPPDGFIGWHNNADAPGYNLIFTWSETGDGWFKYVDHDGNIQTIYDTKGWSLKAGYFGTYEEGDVCYHSAYTRCWRMTHSFVVERHDKEYWLDCIEHISNGE